MSYPNTLKATCIAASLGFPLAAPAQADKNTPIRISINEWTGQQLSSHILGGILTEAGFKVEYVAAGNTSQWIAMSEGSLNLQAEAWSNSAGDLYPKKLAEGGVIDVGPLGLEAVEEWLYPPYMEERCPGLPNYQALFDCAEAFSTAETFPNGRIIGYPADWGTQDPDQVAAIGLPYQVAPGGSEGTMIAEMRSAVAAEAPILIRFWAPHWIHSEIKLNRIKWDYSSPDCAAGVNQERGNACGFTRASVQKIVSSNFEATWPDALPIVRSFTLTNEVQEAMINEVTNGGKTVEAVAAEWLAENESIWREYIE